MKTFFLMVGSAIAGVVIFVIAMSVYFNFKREAFEAEAVSSGESKRVKMLPPAEHKERYHGSHATFRSEFPKSARDTVLDAGPGRLVGHVTSRGKPQAGFRIRLALNGAAMSQWALSAEDGRYEVAVPYGTYRIDGYSIDSTVANEVLAGVIDGPHPVNRGDSVVVAEGRPGEAIDFAFVEPVRKIAPPRELSIAKPVILSWQPYPQAETYRVQLIEQKEPQDYTTNRGVFEWRELPMVPTPSINLAEHKVALKKGHYYTLEIEALGPRRARLSASPREFYKPDFRAVD